MDERKKPLPTVGVPSRYEPTIIATPDNLLVMHNVPAHLSNYSRVVRTPTIIVLHCTDGCEGVAKDTDEAFDITKPGRNKSFHYAVDADSATQCVKDEYTAWHARGRGNAIGIGIELCGRADQSRAEWLDAISLPTLNNAARLVARLCTRWNIPAKVINDRALLNEESGITTHQFVSSAWKQSNHYDPGPGFPLGAFVAAVAVALA
jgi:N-acetyl-anhydromuramyl-L-alanine amidase AmpD